MMMAMLMLQLLYIYIRRSNEMPSSSSPSPPHLPFTNKHLFSPSNPNSPVSSLQQLLPNVLKTGYLHLNTNLKVWHPPPTQNDIPVSQSIKIVDPTPGPVITHISQKSLTPPTYTLTTQTKPPVLWTEYKPSPVSSCPISKYLF